MDHHPSAHRSSFFPSRRLNFSAFLRTWRLPDFGSASGKPSHLPDDDYSGLIQKPLSTNEGVDACTSTTSVTRKKRRRFSGWRVGVAASAGAVAAVLLVNLTLTIWASVHFSTSDGIGTAFEGDCHQVNAWTTWLHILINIVSAILLGASNYTMQCLTSPSRSEVDRAHAKGEWLDIGVPSFRNLFLIKRNRAWLAVILAVSSFPIHLLINSAVFKTISANSYDVFVVNPDWFNGGSLAPYVKWDFTRPYPDLDSQSWPLDEDDFNALVKAQQNFSNDFRNPDLVTNLSSSDCMAAYGTSYVSSYGDVAAVTSSPGNITKNQTIFLYHKVHGTAWQEDETWAWICADQNEMARLPYYPYSTASRDCNIAYAKMSAASWHMNNRKIDYCLARKTPSHCKLQFSVHIMVVVVVMNALKMICMLWTLYRHREITLVTVGDALTSFLDCPDDLTQGRCLMRRTDVGRGPLAWRQQPSSDTPGAAKFNSEPLPVTYQTIPRGRWFSGTSKTRLWITIVLILVALISVSGLLGLGISHLTGILTNASPLSLPFGGIDSRTIIDDGALEVPGGGSAGLILAVLVSNSPQAICSLLYMSYNSLFTSMYLAYEYSEYAVPGRRKPLRVTAPHGQQRSTYYLQLPYVYSIPLVTASAVLHWLISQSLFVVRVTLWQDRVEQKNLHPTRLGYSPLPILLTLILGLIMVLVMTGIGFRRLASTMPVAGSCSVTIAAAAHRPKGDVDAAYLPVSWGEVKGEGTDEVGHCCFTSEDTQPLQPGRMYAGARVDRGLHGLAQRVRERHKSRRSA